MGFSPPPHTSVCPGFVLSVWSPVLFNLTRRDGFWNWSHGLVWNLIIPWIYKSTFLSKAYEPGRFPPGHAWLGGQGPSSPGCRGFGFCSPVAASRAACASGPASCYVGKGEGGRSCMCVFCVPPSPGLGSGGCTWTCRRSFPPQPGRHRLYLLHTDQQ